MKKILLSIVGVLIILAGMVYISFSNPNIIGMIFVGGLFIFVALLGKCYIYKESEENEDDHLIEDDHK